MLNNKTALIIEDDAHSLLALGSLLDTFGIEYKRNTTGAGVLEQAQRLQPDIILLDTSLPGGDSLVIYTTLQNDPTLSHVPVIAMIENESDEDFLQMVRGANFAGLVTKPVDQRTFADLLQQLLGDG